LISRPVSRVSGRGSGLDDQIPAFAADVLPKKLVPSRRQYKSTGPRPMRPVRIGNRSARCIVTCGSGSQSPTSSFERFEQLRLRQGLERPAMSFRPRLGTWRPLKLFGHSRRSISGHLLARFRVQPCRPVLADATLSSTLFDRSPASIRDAHVLTQFRLSEDAEHRQRRTFAACADKSFATTLSDSWL